MGIAAQPDVHRKVELRDAIATIIPSLIKPLKDEEVGIRWVTVRLIGNLVNHGERRLDNIAAS